MATYTTTTRGPSVAPLPTDVVDSELLRIVPGVAETAESVVALQFAAVADGASRDTLDMLASALAQVLYDACNARNWRPPAFRGHFLSCSGRPPARGGNAELPVPRSARDPTLNTARVIPGWALSLGAIAAAILGWAVGMLVAFSVCPEPPYISLRDRILRDDDELEPDLIDIAKDRLRAMWHAVVGAPPPTAADDERGEPLVAVGRGGAAHVEL